MFLAIPCFCECECVAIMRNELTHIDYFPSILIYVLDAMHDLYFSNIFFRISIRCFFSSRLFSADEFEEGKSIKVRKNFCTGWNEKMWHAKAIFIHMIGFLSTLLLIMPFLLGFYFLSIPCKCACANFSYLFTRTVRISCKTLALVFKHQNKMNRENFSIGMYLACCCCALFSESGWARIILCCAQRNAFICDKNRRIEHPLRKCTFHLSLSLSPLHFDLKSCDS